MAAERIELPFTLINVDLQAAELHSNFHENETETETTFVLSGKLYTYITHFSAFMEQKGNQKLERRLNCRLQSVSCSQFLMRTTIYTES
jgi:hypothetical protein